MKEALSHAHVALSELHPLRLGKLSNSQRSNFQAGLASNSQTHALEQASNRTGVKSSFKLRTQPAKFQTFEWASKINSQFPINSRSSKQLQSRGVDTAPPTYA